MDFTRRAGQSFIIDRDIRVTLVEVRGSQVKFSIQAPLEVKIYREEIYKKIQEEARAKAEA